jgi:ABC-type amino acid transport substrate-binding protein
MNIIGLPKRETNPAPAAGLKILRICSMKKLSVMLLALAMALALCACGDRVANTVKTPEEAQNSVIGALSGTSSADMATRYSQNVLLYDNADAMLGDLRSGKLDCVLTNAVASKDLRSGQRGIKRLDELISGGLTFAVAKENADLREKLNEAIGVLREEKVIDGIVKGYAGGSGRTYEAQLDPAQTELKLSLAVKAAYYPYAYTDENGDLVGIDVDIAYALCDYLGVGLELVPLEDGIIEPVLYGRVNFSSGGLLGTEDDRVDYTDPYTDISEELITRK